MKAKSVLLTVPLALSALTFLTLPANAVCWSWKPCADFQGYGYGGTNQSRLCFPPTSGRAAVCLRDRQPRQACGARRDSGAPGNPEQGRRNS